MNEEPTPPPISDERGLCIKENPSGVSERKKLSESVVRMCFSETEEIKGVRCYCVSEERALISD